MTTFLNPFFGWGGVKASPSTALPLSNSNWLSNVFISQILTNLFPPCDIGGSGGQTNAVGDDEGHAKTHDDEEGLESGVLLQGLEGHALESEKVQSK